MKHLVKVLALCCALVLSSLASAPFAPQGVAPLALADEPPPLSFDRGDMEIKRDIRRSIVQDRSLSDDARNIKIVAINGEITLRGPVNSAREKQVIESKAIDVAGVKNVRSQIKVRSGRG